MSENAAVAAYRAEAVAALGLPADSATEAFAFGDGGALADELVETFVAPLLAVDDRFAWDEGEGDRTRTWWLDAHRRYFARRAAALGLAFDEAASPLLYERFEMVHKAGQPGQPVRRSLNM
ncbi:MAG: hypothetical protein RH942_19175 [Kiloniellaceae bacterium]